MKPESLSQVGPAGLRLRRAAFEDVPAMLRVIEEAVLHACVRHYTPAQQQAVYLSYAQHLFVDVLAPYHTVVAEGGGRLVGLAQLDPAIGRLRALFVAPEAQGDGLGRLLMRCVERLARAHGLFRLHGAMSLNAAPFYDRVGFTPCPGPRHLLLSGVVVPIVPMAKRLAPSG